MRSKVLLIGWLGIVFATASFAHAVDCIQRAEGPSDNLDQWSGPNSAFEPLVLEQVPYFTRELVIPEGEDTVVLQIDYCEDFEMVGDFSLVSSWEFGGIGWVMIQDPGNNATILGNLVAPPPSGVQLRDRVEFSTIDLDNNARRSTGVFDVAGLPAGEYVIGVVGTYIGSFPGDPDPTMRFREDVEFDHGFPLTITSVPEPSASLMSALGVLSVLSVVNGNRRRLRAA